MSDKYILGENGEHIKCEDVLEWGRWMEKASRKVANTELPYFDCHVSTVFLGLDHSFRDEGPPILYETMVFGGEHAEYMLRCATWDEAVNQHCDVVLGTARDCDKEWQPVTLDNHPAPE